jgi:hypothetical protein
MYSSILDGFTDERRSTTNSITLEQSERFQDLDKKTQNILLALLDSRDAHSKDLHDQALAIAQMLDRTEVILRDQHDKTRALVVDAMQVALILAKSNFGTSVDNEYASKVCKDEEGIRLLVENKILNSLYFKTILDRQEEIAEAHENTFEWVFRPQSAFVDWLESGHGTYWINGKAGSGKSTLMRYICKSDQTRRKLLSWAGSTPSIMSNFFFWNSGTIEQRSQVGFLRSLLYDILRRHTDLIPIVLPSMWARTYSYAIKPSPRFKPESLSLSRLMSGFKALVTQTIVPLKLCLFIDGLDEYEGDSAQLADLFTDIVTSDNIKICLSSRPLVAFEYAFKTSPSIRLQDLTFEDIRLYVADKLHDNKRFQQLALQEPEKAPALVHELVTKADGVFLWVTLVVESILIGLGNRDEIADLQIRLRELPSDLEALFDDMLRKRIGSFYKKKAAMLFQIVRASREQNDQLEVFGDMPLPLTLLALSFADENLDNEELLAFQSPCKPLTEVQTSIRCNTTEDRLKTSCAGLLEVQGATDGDFGVSRIDIAKPNGKVQYLHRTVKDYLEQPHVWQSITEKTEKSQFDPHLQLLKSCVLQVKTSHVEAQAAIPDYLWCCMALGLEYSRHAELKVNHEYIPLLDQLDHLMSNLLRPRESSYPGHWARFYRPGDERPFEWDDTTAALAVEYGLYSYLSFKFRQSGPFDKAGRPLLDYAVSPNPRKQRYGICQDVVSILLRYGADPNKRYNLTTPWENALAFAYSLQFPELTLGLFGNERKQPKRSEVMNLLCLFRQFIDHGADLNESCVVRGTYEELNEYRPVLFIVNDAFVRWYPEESGELASALKQREASEELVSDFTLYRILALNRLRGVRLKFW